MTRDDNYRQAYVAHDLIAGEALIGTWIATRGWGGGGGLVVTSQRILYEPMRTPQKLLLGPVADALGFGGFGRVADGAIDSVEAMKPLSISLLQVAEIQQDGDSSVVVKEASGETWRFTLSMSLYTTRWSGSNTVARNEAVRTIRQAASAARGTTPPPRTPETADFWSEDNSPERARLRALAISSQKNVYIQLPGTGPSEPGPYFSPDGMLRIPIPPFTQPVPTDASLPSNLIGGWLLGGELQSRWPNEPAYVSFRGDGTMPGKLYLFSAAPPLANREAYWWWSASRGVLSMKFGLILVEEFEGIMEFRFDIRLTSISENELSGTVVDGWNEGNVIFKRFSN